MQGIKILGIPGSTRKGSYNRGLLVAAQALAPEGVTVDLFDLSPIPFFSADSEPESVVNFRKALTEADGVLIASPEYNFSMTGVLKNALDWGSRPAFASPFVQKKVAVVSASPGPAGGVRGQQHLKTVLLGMTANVFPTSEFAVGLAKDRFDDLGLLTDTKTKEKLIDLLERFASWIRG